MREASSGSPGKDGFRHHSKEAKPLGRPPHFAKTETPNGSIRALQPARQLHPGYPTTDMCGIVGLGARARYCGLQP